MSRRAMYEEEITDITNFQKYSFISTIINTGEIPEYINYCGETYDFDRKESWVIVDKSEQPHTGNRYIFKSDDCIEVMSLIPDDMIQKAQELHKYLGNL